MLFNVEVVKMGLESVSNRPSSGVRLDSLFNSIQGSAYSQSSYAKLAYMPDSVAINAGFQKYLSEKSIIEMIKVSSEIKRILNVAKIPLKINMKMLNDLVQNHLTHTKKIAVGIVGNLPQGFKSEVNLQSLQKAAVLHDIGKVLIPERILNKKGALNAEELAIVQKHPTLSYEMLKNTDLDETTLNLVKNHHQNAQKTGYPCVTGNFIADINLQILCASDVYSALREKRSYKPELNKNQALAIIHQDMMSGKLHPCVFKALVDYANKNEGENMAKTQDATANPLLQTCKRLLFLNTQRQPIPSR